MKRHGSQGSAILMALLLIAVVGVVTASAIAVLMARSGSVAEMSAAAERRIALENSKALAQEFMLERVLPSASGGAFEYSLSPVSLGGITIPPWSSSAVLSISPIAGVNHFGPGNGGGYALDLTATVRDGTSNAFQRKYQLKSRAPAFAGTLLALQAPASGTIATSAVDVEGAAFVWQPGLSQPFTPDTYSVPAGSAPVTYQNSAGNTILPCNLALPRQIANPRAGLAAAQIYSGEFDAIHNADPAANSSYSKATSGICTTVGGGSDSESDDSDGVTYDGPSRTVTITLAKLELGNVVIQGDVRNIVMQGQAAANDAAADAMPAILVFVETTSTLEGITFNDHNSRRVDLAIKSPAGNTTDIPLNFTTGAASWRLLIELENSPLLITTSGIVTVRGGVRTNRNIALTAGSGFKLTLDSDPKFLERLATRTAWVESYAQ